MRSQEYANFLLSNIPNSSLVSGGTTVLCRCFYCPDSANPNHKHFYISIPQDDQTPSLYYCHKCHSSGMVKHTNLIEWGIFDSEIAVELTEHNKNCGKYSGNDKYFIDKYRLNNTFISESEISKIKLDYINNRIGTNFTYQDLLDLKIVLNLKDVLKCNYINHLTRDQNIVDQLDINFLGFISIDNAFLNMRRICDSGLVYKTIDKKYINYKIYDKYDTSQRFYTIPTQIDLLRPERLKIHIAEGPFDILSIYQNLRHREPGIYTSIAGSNYLGMAIYMINTFKLPYVEFHYYPDNDSLGSNRNMQKVKNYLYPLGIPLYVHRNTMPGEKDFGVSPDRIKESYSLF